MIVRVELYTMSVWRFPLLPSLIKQHEKNSTIQLLVFCWANNNDIDFFQGRYNEAVLCYASCIEICPDNVVPYTNRALCYLKLQQVTLEDTISDDSEAGTTSTR